MFLPTVKTLLNKLCRMNAFTLRQAFEWLPHGPNGSPQKVFRDILFTRKGEMQLNAVR